MKNSGIYWVKCKMKLSINWRSKWLNLWTDCWLNRMNVQGLLTMWNTKWTWRTKWFRRTLKMPVTSWMTVTTRWTLQSKLNSNAKTKWYKNSSTALCPRLKVWTPGSNKKNWQGLSKKLIWGQRCPESRTQSGTNWTDLKAKILRSLTSCQKWSKWK